LDYFAAYKARHAGDLELVLVGESVMDLPPLADVVVTGYVDDAARDAAIAGSVALVHPSYFESFSMVLTEAFALERPALVQHACAVTEGHARRSRAAIAYRGFGEFEAAVEAMLDRPDLRSALGRNGRAYIEREYRWPTVLDRYEELLRRTVDGGRSLASRLTARATR
jgi:glycosyltransferase involved in cell wall biosynthesis